ncbi:SufD family Fe-S cluster assembly protein [uncultured Treponema sp.]|uniref:SufB/SufD family protein n=1 Tax=uncultured Treponema sp. TaxID=162155 RepID=UPI0025E779AC|nr:SufD family Fe-S cluster assembly protein [uncultured Treponema sp.]
MTETLKFTEINKIPCLTWNWLKMNHASLELDADSQIISEKKEINAVKKGEIIHIPLTFEDGKRYEHEHIITAEEGAEVTVILDYTSLPKAAGFSSIKTQLIAKPYSKIHLVKVQLLGENFIQIDDTTGVCDESAKIEVTQIELGASKVYAQVKNELNGYSSKFKSDTAYICKSTQLLDMNYLVNHYGPKTDTKMLVKGVVDDNALKVYRGTIDFKNGCTDATGDEQEETLLMSKNAVNKSIPMILCDEENVSGTHGATLGRLGSDELFYMQSRGISEEEAKKMMMKAKILSVASLIPNEDVRSKIEAFLN